MDGIPAEELWNYSREKVIGFISTWDFMCEASRLRHLDKSDEKSRDNSKQKLVQLIEETSIILECLQKLIEICCDVVPDCETDLSQTDISQSDISQKDISRKGLSKKDISNKSLSQKDHSQNDNSTLILNEQISRALWGKNRVRLILKSDVVLFAQVSPILQNTDNF